MKAISKNTMVFSLVLAATINVKAGSRQCYVQKEDANGVFKDALAMKTIDENDFQNHLLYQEGDFLYTVKVSENGNIQVTMFNSKNKSSLVIATATRAEDINLINAQTKKLVACGKLSE